MSISTKPMNIKYILNVLYIQFWHKLYMDYEFI